MSPSNLRRNLLNYIVIIIAIMIVIAVYLIIGNPNNETLEILTVDNIIENIEEYTGKKVAIEGYYYHESRPEGEGVISSSIVEEGQSSIGIYPTIPVNHSNVNISLADRIKYRFIGQIILDDSIPGFAYILISDEIEPV